MKKSELKVGETYLVNGSRDWSMSNGSYYAAHEAVYLDFGWRDRSYSSFSRGGPRSIKDGTQALVLKAYTGSLGEQARKNRDKALAYRVEDYEAGKPAPEGWDVVTVPSGHIRETWAEWLEHKQLLDEQRAASKARNEALTAQRLVEESQEREAVARVKAFVEAWEADKFPDLIARSTQKDVALTASDLRKLLVAVI